MRITWADARTRYFEVTLNNQFFDLGPYLEADEEAGTIIYVPQDQETGCLLFDHQTDDWARRVVTGRVRIYERRMGALLC